MLRSFEDYHTGQQGEIPARTVTEADIVNFGCLTEDYNQPHMDAHAMETSMYGARVAHGLLGTSLVTGMLSLHAPHLIGRGVPGAYLAGFEANYRDGVRLGETIHVRWQVAKTAPSHTQGFGLVTAAFEVVTHRGTPVYDGTFTSLVRMESAGDATLQLQPGTPWPDAGESNGRTITETDIVNFAGLTGDYDPRYVDAEFARDDIFGERVAPPLLVFCVAFGRWNSLRFVPPDGPPPPPPVAATAPIQTDSPAAVDGDTMVAGHLNDKATFLAPVRIGDTIRCRFKPLAERPSRSRPGLTIITTGLQVINQRNEVVQEGSTIMMH